jgi:hypothetical protein
MSHPRRGQTRQLSSYPASRSGDGQGAVIYAFPAAPVAPDPWGQVMVLLDKAAAILRRAGWAPEGSSGLRGPLSLTDALAIAAFPRGEEQFDEGAVQLFIMAWTEIVRTAREALGVTPLQFQADPSVERHHVGALLLCTRLRLQAGTADSPQ